MRNIFIIILLAVYLPSTMLAAGLGREFYSIRIYQLKDAGQESRLDAYLQTALLPALHRLGIAGIGVFKPVGNDTAAVKKVYMLIPFKSLEQYTGLQASLDKDAEYSTAGAAYIEATTHPISAWNRSSSRPSPICRVMPSPKPCRAPRLNASTSSAPTKAPPKDILRAKCRCSMPAARSRFSPAS